MNALALVFAIAGMTQAPPGAGQPTEVVAVAGCLKETAPEKWVLTSASEPVVSTANAPSAKELAAIPKNGKNEYALIGVSIFNLPAHRNHHVLIKGLYIKAVPQNRVNITALTMIAAECPAK